MAGIERKIHFDKKRLKYVMKKKKITQENLARIIYRTVDTLKDANRNEMMMPDNLDEIARHLNVNLDWLRGYEFISKEKPAAGSNSLVDEEGYIIPEYSPAYVSVQGLIKALQGNETDPFKIAAENPSETIETLSTQSYIEKTLQGFQDTRTDKWIRYSDLFDRQNYYELFRIIEKIVQTAASQQIAYHPDHISLMEIFDQIRNEPTEIITIDMK